MRRWAIDASPQGPVYLGYRLGHIKGDSRVFRAVIYNKAAMVLHMLRRMRRRRGVLPRTPRLLRRVAVPKAGTDDFRAGDGEGQRARTCSRVLRGVDLRARRFRASQVRHTVQGSTATVTIEQRGEIDPGAVSRITLASTPAATPSTPDDPGCTKTGDANSWPLTGPLRDWSSTRSSTLAIFEKSTRGPVRAGRLPPASPRRACSNGSNTRMKRGAAVLVEARQPLAAPAAVDVLGADLRRAAERRRDRRHAIADLHLLPVAKGQHRDRHGAQRDGRRDARRPPAGTFRAAGVPEAQAGRGGPRGRRCAEHGQEHGRREQPLHERTRRGIDWRERSESM